jgi:uncharacterized protein YjiS (DUF1127 family)
MSAMTLAALSRVLPLAYTLSRTAAACVPDAGRVGFAPEPHRACSAGLRGVLRAAWRRHRARQCLLGMNAYLLKDIGMSFADAEAEGNKPFWVA